MIFDQYQRYKTVQIIANIVREQLHKSSLTVLEIGSNEECNLETVLPNDEIRYSDIELSEKMRGDKRFIELDGCNMSGISDGQYDLVVALDVLEHVAAERREQFMIEANRVAGGAAIICFPYKTDYNESAERRVNDYYRMIHGTDHKWLIEHIQNGLPQIEVLTQALITNGISFCEFYHGDIFVWEEMMKGLFTVYDLRNGGDYFTQIDKLYEEQIYFNDSSDMTYRVFMLLSKEEKIIQYIADKLREQYTNKVSEKVRTLLFRCIDDIKYYLISERGRKTKVQHQIYYTYDEVFNEDHKFICTSEGLNANCIYIDQTIEINKEYHALRFDPIEGECCILRNLKVESKRGNIDYKVINGIYNNNEIVFCVDDPQIYIDLSDEKGIEWIRIRGELLRTGFPDAVIKYSINEKMDSLTSNLVERANASEKQQSEIKNLIVEYMQKQNKLSLELKELSRCNEFLDSKIKQCEVIQNDLADALQEKEEWKEKSEYWEERCIKMERTVSWRITGILRKVGKLLGDER